MMTIEGMVGNLLEEYLATILHPYGWYCCWGSTIDAVDFCKEDGSLLQVKTSNTWKTVPASACGTEQK